MLHPESSYYLSRVIDYLRQRVSPFRFLKFKYFSVSLDKDGNQVENLEGVILLAGGQVQHEGGKGVVQVLFVLRSESVALVFKLRRMSSFL